MVADEVNSRYQQLRLAPAESLRGFDWNLNLSSGFVYNKAATFSSSDTKTEQIVTTLGLEKSFLTGTKAGVEFNRVSQKFDKGSLLFAQVPPSATLDTVGFTLEQSLLGDFLGSTSRATVKAAELNFEANSLLRADELQESVLEGLRLFWNTYVSQENFKETLASRDRYKQLVSTVKRKASYGYTAPGELSQVQAELEGREQAVKRASIDYLANLEKLQLYLNLDPGTEITFEVPNQIPPLPELPRKDLENLRELRSTRLKVEAAEESYSASKAKSYPQVKFVGNLYSSGVDEASESALPKAMSGSNLRYYAGVQLNYQFGSDYQTEELINRKASLELEKTRLRRQLWETKDLEAQLQRKVQAFYAVAESAKKQKELRDKTVSELQKSYNQGRTDIRNLIESLNAFFSAEVQLTRALGDYQISLNEWAAARDELIPDPEMETK
jgi:outer membrane protein TolC